jgi:hypothetical protein
VWQHLHAFVADLGAVYLNHELVLVRLVLLHSKDVVSSYVEGLKLS